VWRRGSGSLLKHIGKRMAAAYQRHMASLKAISWRQKQKAKMAAAGAKARSLKRSAAAKAQSGDAGETGGAELVSASASAW
jgi:hypothetical protein